MTAEPVETKEQAELERLQSELTEKRTAFNADVKELQSRIKELQDQLNIEPPSKKQRTGERHTILCTIDKILRLHRNPHRHEQWAVDE